MDDATLRTWAGRTREPDWFRERRVRAWQEWQALPPDQRGEIALPRDVGGIEVTGDVPSGVVLKRFQDLSAEDHCGTQKSLGFLLPPLGEAMLLTQILTVSDVLIVRIPDGLVPSSALRVCVHGPSTHIVVMAGKGSVCTIVEELTGAGQVLHAAEVWADESARVEYISVNTMDPSARLLLWQRGSVGAHATLTWRNATLGGRDVTQDLRSRVAGECGVSQVDWLFYGRRAERQRLSVRNVFDAPRGSGEVSMKGVAEENAHTACRGLIDVGLQGAGTDTYLTQEVLMLDPSSKVDAVPGLEIKTNDVKASHSATVARVTEEDLFYFASRGIDEYEARQMFVLGFVGELAGRIRDPAASASILAAIEAKYRR